MTHGGIVVPMAAPKSGIARTPEQNERAREYARAFLKSHDNNRTKAAEALGVAQPTFSNFLNGRSGVGNILEAALARALGISRSMLLDGIEEVPQRTVVLDPTQPIFANVEGWEEAARSVAEREPHLKPYLPQAGQISAYRTDRPVTRETVLLLANLVRELERDDGGAAARELEEIKAEEADREARQVEGERRIREMQARGEKAPSLPMMMKQLREEGWKPGPAEGTKKGKGAKK